MTQDMRFRQSLILCRGMRAKAAFHRNSYIVEDEIPGNAAKGLKRVDYGILFSKLTSFLFDRYHPAPLVFIRFTIEV